jgi:hypothetical protein
MGEWKYLLPRISTVVDTRHEAVGKRVIWKRDNRGYFGIVPLKKGTSTYNLYYPLIKRTGLVREFQ